MMTERECELHQYTRWARHDFGGCWTLALAVPYPPKLMIWLCATYGIETCVPLPSGNAAFLIHATPKTCATLMRLPGPKWGGSQHECNLVSWP